MSNLVVGNSILERGLVEDADAGNLKNASYDLTIGEIIPIGEQAHSSRQFGKKLETYFLAPREMVLVLSEESFNLPGDVTGHATLRTTFTKKGLLALNVGIIDPFFRGPISTALLKFSDRADPIRWGKNSLE